jgi:CheY-like chemotaxis protein
VSDPQQPHAARFDIFEPGDKTALVCMDVAEVERIIIEQLSAIGYKVHTGISVEDLVFKMRAHPYDVIVIAENFCASAIDHNPLLDEATRAPTSQRHQQLIVLIGASLHTTDEMQAFQRSVDLVVNLADAANLRPVIRRAAQRHQEFYGRYLEAIAAADVP